MSDSYSTAPTHRTADTGTVRRVSWGAIFAGTAVAVALMIFFTTLGIGIGASAFDPQYEQNPASGLGIGSGIYVIVTQLISLAAGGYVAARLAGIPRTIASTLHGAAVWAVATIFIAWSAVVGGGAIFGAASSAITASASAASNVGQAIVPDDLSLPNPSELAGAVSMDALPEEVQSSLQEQGVTEENIREEAQEAFSAVFSQEQRQAAMTEARETLGEILRTPGNAGEDITSFFDQLVAGPDAIVSEEDRQEAMAVIERRLGITPPEAESIVQSVQDSIETAIDEAQAAVEAAREQAVEAAQAASSAVSTTALLLSLASILGLAAACGAAFAGKPESMVGDRVGDHV